MPEPFETDGMDMRKRNSCKAIVVRDGHVLLTVNRDDMGDFYLLPGGGQKFGETLTEALMREVLEETGWLVRPKRLVLVRDYIGANHEFRQYETDVHQTELFFLASPLRKEDRELVPDPWQTGVEWVAPEDLAGRRIYPSALDGILPEIISGSYTGPVYIGDVN